MGVVFELLPAARGDDPTGPARDIATVESARVERPPGLFGSLNAPPVHLDLSIDYLTHTPLKSFPGSFTCMRDRVTLGTWLPLPGPFFFGLDLDTEAASYSGKWGLIMGGTDQNQTLWQMSIGPKIIDRVNDTLTLYVGSVFIFAGDLDAEVQDSLRYELDLAVQLKLTSKITLTFGAGVRTGIEARPSFYPIAAFEYGRLKIFLEGGILETTWPLLEEAEGHHELDFVASFGVDLRQYRLAEYSGHVLTPVPGGVLRDTRYPLVAGLRYSPFTGLRATLTGGGNLLEKLEVDDHLGRPLARSHAIPAPCFMIRIEIDI
ncbi:MAG TPA: hypothetical protein VFF73_30365 [Planctomycetota bacterium]|nr:hypothetical protein [Planctomycetota bacterium]